MMMVDDVCGPTIIIQRVKLLCLLYFVCKNFLCLHMYASALLPVPVAPRCTYNHYTIKSDGWNNNKVRTHRRYRSLLLTSFLTKQQQIYPEINEEDENNDTVNTNPRRNEAINNQQNTEGDDLIQSTIAKLKSTTSDSSSTSSYSVTVLYNGNECQINVNENETILAALERQSIQLISSLDITELPSDCRRGNCMTCVAARVQSQVQQAQVKQVPTAAAAAQQVVGTGTNRVAGINEDSITKKLDPLVRGEDGLSPYVSDRLNNAGYVLTCSSTVVGDGLVLQLQQNNKVWKEMYQERLSDTEMNEAARTCMARVIRKADERNIQRWAIETEAAYQKSPSITLPTDEDL